MGQAISEIRQEQFLQNYWADLHERSKETNREWYQEKVKSRRHKDVIEALQKVEELKKEGELAGDVISPEVEMKMAFQGPFTSDGPTDCQINPEKCCDQDGMSWESILLLMLRQNESKDTNSIIYFFIPKKKLLEMEGALPCFQILARQGMLHGFKVDMAAAVSGKLRKKFAVISHRWSGPGHPDPDGDQLKKIQEMAMNDDLVQYIWIDFACIPQDWKTVGIDHWGRYYGREGGEIPEGKILEKKCDENNSYFKKALKGVNMLYIGGEVWVLLDIDYIRRFWCILESFLGTHEATTSGLRASLVHIKVECMGVCADSPEVFTQALYSIVHKCNALEITASQMLEKLKKDTAIAVTNQADKSIQIEVLGALEEKVMQYCR